MDKELIKYFELDDLFEVISILQGNKSTQGNEDLYVVASRLNELNKKFNSSLISYQDYNIEKNKVRQLLVIYAKKANFISNNQDLTDSKEPRKNITIKGNRNININDIKGSSIRINSDDNE